MKIVTFVFAHLSDFEEIYLIEDEGLPLFSLIASVYLFDRECVNLVNAYLDSKVNVYLDRNVTCLP